MRISLIAVGTKMPAWVNQGVAEYGKRMPRELKLEWREIPLARRGKDANAQQLCTREGEQIIKAIPAGDKVIALDVLGKRLSTELCWQRGNLPATCYRKWYWTILKRIIFIDEEEPHFMNFRTS